MEVLYLSDRLSVRGGADQHLLQVIGAATSWARVTIAFGRREADAALPSGAQGVRIKGLTSAVASEARLGQLPSLLQRADLVHVQNVMNPVALAMAVRTGRTVVTIQDHRVFCPGIGKTLPDGQPCRHLMSDDACRSCLADPEYRNRSLQLTAARRAALAGARLLVLSRYMAGELAQVGLPGAEIMPPWIECSPQPATAGNGFVLGGRLVPHKGVLDAWRAWRQAGTGQPLRVAGIGPIADSLAGGELLGWLPEGQLRGVLAQARALLFPTFWQEPFGIIGVQALAMGTPVIVADAGGTAEWSGTGCLNVAPGDPSAMAAAISLLAADDRLAQSLGEQGRIAVAEHYSQAVIEPKLRRTYQSVVTRQSVVTQNQGNRATSKA